MQPAKLKRFITIAICISIIAFFAYVLGWSSLLTVKNVEISGTQSSVTITNELKSKDLTLMEGMKLARVDIQGIKSTLSKMDWLARYSVDRNWLTGKITLSITEKIGVAKAGAADGSIVYFDQDGQLFKPVSATQLAAMNNLPLVQSQGNSREDLAEVAKLLQQLPTEISGFLSNLSGISVAKSGYISMKTMSGNRSIEIIWGRADSIPQKSKVLMALMDLPENSTATKFDLSLPDSPIVS